MARVRVGVREHGHQTQEGLRRRVSGRIWPSGDVTVGAVPSKPDQDWEPGELGYWSESDVERGVGPFHGAERLNLSKLHNSHNGTLLVGQSCAWPRKKRGLKGITGRGRKMVKSAGALIKRRYPHHRVTFCTVTLPPLQQSQRSGLVQCWPELVRQLLQRISRRLESKALPRLALSVSEIQPKRLQSSGQAYLHLHLVWLNHPNPRRGWAVSANDIRSFVSKFLVSRLGPDANGYVNVNVKAVEASITAYLSKYMSKGGECLQEALEDWGEDVCPPTWWNMTKALRDWVKSEIVEGEAVGELLEDLVSDVMALDGRSVFHWLRPIEIELDGAIFRVGWRGWIKQEWLDFVLELLR